MDSESLTYIVSLVVLFLLLCAAVILAVASGAVDVVTDYYGLVSLGF
ncbi:hypothetical protein NP511_09260 [Natrinema thermotolerans]|uniref:Uncharacterized protein n=1 Tax=Natrinema thermotolerans TaxID=121872 RepID=A0AAF0PID0_9EURY|nr:hypothetical protein [Natrinema thermotolerans]WMT09800.1 hypothetical protein NP511_09260 [Natrinema thermotolerans]